MARARFVTGSIEEASADALLKPVDERGEISGNGPRAVLRAGLAKDLSRDERTEELESMAEAVRETAAELKSWTPSRSCSSF